MRSATQLFDRIDINSTIDLPEQLGFLLRPVAIADCIDEQVAKCLALEQFAQHVIDLATERGPCLFKLFQKTPINFALASVRSAQVPEVANLRLPDTVDAAEALLQPVRVPG